MRRHLTYANVMSTLAVFLLLGGVGIAAKATIGSKDIKKNAVKSKHLKNGQVKSKDIKDNQIKSKDVKDGNLKVDDLETEERFTAILTPGGPDLMDGGQGDCRWNDAFGSGLLPTVPASFRVDRFGAIRFAGVVSAEEVAGKGDEECGATNPEPSDAAEDGVAMILPPELRPPYPLIFTQGEATVVFLADEPFTTSSGVIPAGAVYSTNPQFGVALDSVSYPGPNSDLFDPSVIRGRGGAEAALPGLVENLVE